MLQFQPVCSWTNTILISNCCSVWAVLFGELEHIVYSIVRYKRWIQLCEQQVEKCVMKYVLACFLNVTRCLLYKSRESNFVLLTVIQVLSIKSCWTMQCKYNGSSKPYPESWKKIGLWISETENPIHLELFSPHEMSRNEEKEQAEILKNDWNKKRPKMAVRNFHTCTGTVCRCELENEC